MVARPPVHPTKARSLPPALAPTTGDTMTTPKPEGQAVPPSQEDLDYQEALEYYYRLQPGAIEEYNKYILSRTPSELQGHMNTILAPDLPKIMVSDTQPVPVKDAQGVDVPGSPGTARSTGQYSGYIELIIPAAPEPPERLRDRAKP